MIEEIQIADDDAIETKVRRIGDQIHNLGCGNQNDEALSDELGSIAFMCWGYGKEIATQLAALKEENKRLLRELSDAGSRIVDLEAGEEILRARMAELEKRNG